MALLALCTGGSVIAAETRHYDAVDFLPPEQPWDGKSRELVVANNHPWITPSEQSGLTRTPRYEETIAWLKKLVAAAPELEMISIGLSDEDRDIWMVIASSDKTFTPETIHTHDKPLMLAQSGIHSGEIDGKDAGLMLLRDMTVRGTRRELLKQVNLLFIPILSVDGHERFSKYSRINQRGPVEMGWRSNARNLNLNRDYTKLETNGVKAVVGVINQWVPDLYVDLHVTDGVDYQYDITWGLPQIYGWSPGISRWAYQRFQPAINQELTDWGHTPGPFVWAVNGKDLSDGNLVWMGSPRFSDSYGSARHLPTILVENHSLKSYDQRVLGTYIFLKAAMELLASDIDALRAAVAQDKNRLPDTLTVKWSKEDRVATETHEFKGIKSESYNSDISGGEVVRWTAETDNTPVDFHYHSKAEIQIRRPRYYYIPSAWGHIADKLIRHGIVVEQFKEDTTLRVERYHTPDAGFDQGDDGAFDQSSAIYEGRVRIKPGHIETEQTSVSLRAGSYRINTHQPLGDLVMLLMEPTSPDSFFQWGYFLEILTETEYNEDYVMEPMARQMLEDDPELKRAFEQKLANDPQFAADPKRRLKWFYQQTPYYDQAYRVYPVYRSVDHTE